MGRRRNKGRNVNGFLLLDKPFGVTSNKALQQVKQLFKAQKAGHTGSLDPLATGLLPLCFGAATKISAFLLDADKRYRVTVKLGETTTTADAEGEIMETCSYDHVTEQLVMETLPRFTGEIQQIPPMYSALKHQGKRLYELAREGKEVVREPREITIYSLELVSFDLPELVLEVHCTKGTYVRTLAEDIGAALQCGGHVSALRRTAVGCHDSDHMVTMEDLEAAAEQGFSALDALLKPVDYALSDWPAVNLDESSSFYLKQGQAVQVPKAPTEGWVRVYGMNDKFLGLGQIDDHGRVAPKRLMTSTH